jgi:hypothetical protein
MRTRASRAREAATQAAGGMDNVKNKLWCTPPAGCNILGWIHAIIGLPLGFPGVQLSSWPVGIVDHNVMIRVVLRNTKQHS